MFHCLITEIRDCTLLSESEGFDFLILHYFPKSPEVLQMKEEVL